MLEKGQFMKVSIINTDRADFQQMQRFPLKLAPFISIMDQKKKI